MSAFSDCNQSARVPTGYKFFMENKGLVVRDQLIMGSVKMNEGDKVADYMVKRRSLPG